MLLKPPYVVSSGYSHLLGDIAPCFAAVSSFWSRLSERFVQVRVVLRALSLRCPDSARRRRRDVLTSAASVASLGVAELLLLACHVAYQQRQLAHLLCERAHSVSEVRDSVRLL